jgi:hypothetical protein
VRLPVLVDPLTGPEIEVIPARTTVVGVRFQPGAVPALATALYELADQHVSLAEGWRCSAGRLQEAAAQAESPQRALTVLQACLLREFHSAAGADPLVRA